MLKNKLRNEIKSGSMRKNLRKHGNVTFIGTNISKLDYENIRISNKNNIIKISMTPNKIAKMFIKENPEEIKSHIINVNDMKDLLRFLNLSKFKQYTDSKDSNKEIFEIEVK